MIYAQINNNIIVNTVDIEDSSLVSLFSQGYDLFIRIDTLFPMPSISWTYSPVTSSFSPPLTLSQSVLSNCLACGNGVIFQWDALNLEGSIYSAGQTLSFLSYTGQLYQLLSLGYLNDANDALTAMIADTSPAKIALDPFVTNDILETFQTQIQNCLSSLSALD